jgi:hypothetical protein
MQRRSLRFAGALVAAHHALVAPLQCRNADTSSTTPQAFRPGVGCRPRVRGWPVTPDSFGLLVGVDLQPRYEPHGEF